MASVEGPLSLGVSTVVIDHSGNLTDTTISFSKFVEVGGSANTSKVSGNWVALLAVLVVLFACSYIIYSGIEENSMEVEDDTESSNVVVEDDEHLRELALPQETEEEKEN